MGTVDINKLLKEVSKKNGEKIGTLADRKGTEVPYWIPTGSLWLDSIICAGRMGGIPGGCITEIAGLPSCVSENSVVDLMIFHKEVAGSFDVEEPVTVTVKQAKEFIDHGKVVFIKSRNAEGRIVYERIGAVIPKGIMSTKVYEIENGDTFECIENHFVYTESGWESLKDITTNKTHIMCDDNNFRKIVDVHDGDDCEIYDFEIGSTHCYFADGVLHHNSGKSYMAAQILVNAQKMGMLVVWFDSENAADATFIEKMGADISQVMYVPANSIEDVFDLSETIMSKAEGTPVLFVWDSVANTPAKVEWDKTYDPSQVIGLPARVMSFGLRRITNLLASTKSTFLILNQLKANIGPTMMSEPLVTPCGKAIQFGAHLRLFLVSRKAKSHHVFVGDDKVGSDLKVDIKKSRFGTEGRKCALKILWGNGVRICDEESWLEAIQGSQYYENRGAWKYLKMDDNPNSENIVKFQAANWMEILKDEKVKERVKWIISVEMVDRFLNKTETDTFGFSDPDDFVGEE